MCGRAADAVSRVRVWVVQNRDEPEYLDQIWLYCLIIGSDMIAMLFFQLSARLVAIVCVLRRVGAYWLVHCVFLTN